MTDDNLDKRMEDWAASEAEAAPDLRPTREMYRLVESKGRRVRAPWTQSRWVASVGVAVAALLLVIIGGLILVDPAVWFGPAPIQQVAFVEQRLGPKVHLETPEKGKSRGDPSFQQLTLQVHRGADGTIETLDLRNPLTKPITLTTTDDFRLLIQPAQPRHLYIYLVSPNDDDLALHPETGFNPLHPVETTLLPAPSNWFYLSGESGICRLLLITSTDAIPELDQLYNQYIQRSDDPNFESPRKALSEYLESIITGSAKNIEAWELVINLQD